ncbi:MAG: methylglyoxal synthase [Flavobacteriaceae bacterium]|nr:methylglyoxal synthase [Flavobacteriaceae bacterium]
MSSRNIPVKKTIALVAHDHKKDELLDWIEKHKIELKKHQLLATATTGKLIEEKLKVKVDRVLSGPLGGDQQVGAMIANGDIQMVIFFWDPMEAQPHDSDVKALLRLGVVWNIPMACNPATADFVLESQLMTQNYQAEITDYTYYLNRKIN